MKKNKVGGWFIAAMIITGLCSYGVVPLLFWMLKKTLEWSRMEKK